MYTIISPAPLTWLCQVHFELSSIFNKCALTQFSHISFPLFATAMYTMDICGDYGPFDFRSSCVRATWAALLPAVIVFALCVFSIPIPRPLAKLVAFIKTPFIRFLTLHEAEALDVKSGKVVGDEPTVDVLAPVPLWRTLAFVFVGLTQTLFWTTLGSFRLYENLGDLMNGVRPILVGFGWLYTIVRPITRPTATPPFDLFAIYISFFVTGALQAGGIIYDYNVFQAPLPSAPIIAAQSVNLITVIVLLVIILEMPLAQPSNQVKKEDIVRALIIFRICVITLLSG